MIGPNMAITTTLVMNQEVMKMLERGAGILAFSELTEIIEVFDWITPFNHLQMGKDKLESFQTVMKASDYNQVSVLLINFVFWGQSYADSYYVFQIW